MFVHFLRLALYDIIHVILLTSFVVIGWFTWSCILRMLENAISRKKIAMKNICILSSCSDDDNIAQESAPNPPRKIAGQADGSFRLGNSRVKEANAEIHQGFQLLEQYGVLGVSPGMWAKAVS